MTPEHQKAIDTVMYKGYRAALRTLRAFQTEDERTPATPGDPRPMLRETRLYRCLEMLARVAEGDYTVERGDCLYCLIEVEGSLYRTGMRDIWPEPYKMTPKSVLRRLPIGDMVIAAQEALARNELPDPSGIRVAV